MSVDTEFQHQVVYKQAKSLSIHKQSNSSKSPVQCKTTLNALSKVQITPEHTVESVKVMEDNLVQLKNAFSEELLMFVANKDKTKVDYPSSLSSLERKALHEVCRFNYTTFTTMVVVLNLGNKFCNYSALLIRKCYVRTVVIITRHITLCVSAYNYNNKTTI